MKRALFALVAGVFSVWTFLVPDAPGFAYPEFARIFFWHFPCPIMLTFLIFAAVYFAFRMVRGPSTALARISESLLAGAPSGFSMRLSRFVRTLSGVDTTDPVVWDLRCVAALELGFVFLVLTMFSGVLFSKIQWGAWWNWDPRQTSFLLASLFYMAYFAVRAAFPDPEKRAANSAAYLFATLLPQIFLIFVYPRIMASLHPSNTIMGGLLVGQYRIVTIGMMLIVGVLTVWLYRLRVRAGLLLIRELDGTLEVPRRPAGPRVVARPVSLPVEGGPDR